MSKETPKNMQFSAEEMRRVLGSAEGKQLLAMLSQNGGLKTAVEAFKKGDMAGAQEALRPVIETEEAGELLQKINGK